MTGQGYNSNAYTSNQGNGENPMTQQTQPQSSDQQPKVEYDPDAPAPQQPDGGSPQQPSASGQQAQVAFPTIGDPEAEARMVAEEQARKQEAPYPYNGAGDDPAAQQPAPAQPQQPQQPAPAQPQPQQPAPAQPQQPQQPAPAQPQQPQQPAPAQPQQPASAQDPAVLQQQVQQQQETINRLLAATASVPGQQPSAGQPYPVQPGQPVPGQPAPAATQPQGQAGGGAPASQPQLPDPVTDPQGFNQSLIQLVQGQGGQPEAQPAAQQPGQQPGLSPEQSQALWSKFQTTHSDLANSQLLVEGAARNEMQRLQAAGIDPGRYAALAPDDFVNRVAAQARQEQAKLTGGQPQPQQPAPAQPQQPAQQPQQPAPAQPQPQQPANRTGGIPGGAPAQATPPGGAPGQGSSFTEEMREMQAKSGFF